MKWFGLAVWAVAIIGAAAWWSQQRFTSDDETPENDDEVRERMERVRDAGNEVGL